MGLSQKDGPYFVLLVFQQSYFGVHLKIPLNLMWKAGLKYKTSILNQSIVLSLRG